MMSCRNAISEASSPLARIGSLGLYIGLMHAGLICKSINLASI